LATNVEKIGPCDLGSTRVARTPFNLRVYNYGYFAGQINQGVILRRANPEVRGKYQIMM